MRIIARFFAAVLLVLIFPAMAQQGVLEQLQGGGGSGLGGQLQGGSGGLSGTPGNGAEGQAAGAASSLDATPTISNVPRPPQPRPESADVRRRVQQIELQQLHQQLDNLESPQSRNAFQDFVLESTGKILPIFGLNLFRNTPSTFAPVDNVPVTQDYIVGPGDEILVSGWGQINVNLSLTVDRNGSINIPRVGVISVANVRYQDLQSHLKAAFSRIYKNFELSVSLGQLRSIQIFVVGHARRPGTYTVSSFSTLVSAIFAAGGPSPTGSLRNVQLKRQGKIIAEMDLYDVLQSGDRSRDITLLPADIIQFIPVGPLVAINGAVNAPAIFELKQGNSIFDLLRWGGGLATTALGQKASVERIEDRKSRKIEEINLDLSGLSKPLRDGDLVTIRSLTPKFDNAVTLRGTVAQPGRYPWHQGMRVRDLIPSKEALLSREYLTNRNQTAGLDPTVARILAQQSVTGTRLSVEDLNRRPKPPEEMDMTFADAIRRLQSEAEVARFLNPNTIAQPPSNALPSDPSKLAEQAQTIFQAQQRSSRPKTEEGKLISQIRPIPYEVNWDYAVIERLNEDLTTSLIPFNLLQALEGDLQQDLPLKPGDVLTVFSKDDLQVPVSRRTKYVRLEGELQHAGVYEIRPAETLRQLLIRVGGITPNAYLFGAIFTRDSTRIEQQKNLDEALNRLERDVQRYNIVRAQNVTSGEDAASLKQQAENQQQLIARLRQIRATGRIVLEIPESGELRDVPDLPLEDGDRLVIPSTPSMVSVFGSVYSENSFIYRPQKQVSDYLSQAGGPTRSADKSSIYVLRADGSVLSKQQTGFIVGSFDATRLMPGDSIVVPEELDRTTITRALRDISQIFYQFGLGAAAIKVLRN